MLIDRIDHGLARACALAAITAYQRYLSPHKGFCCAYRVHTGRRSCSGLGFRAVRRYGVLAGIAVLRKRMVLCGVVHRRHAPAQRRLARSQAGFCDCSCDLPDLSCDAFNFGDAFSCCDACNCDWPSRNRKEKDEEKYVYIPPAPRMSDDVT